MLLEYRNMQAQISYSAVTNCYFGFIEVNADYFISFQASNRAEAKLVMQQVVDQYLRAVRVNGRK